MGYILRFTSVYLFGSNSKILWTTAVLTIILLFSEVSLAQTDHASSENVITINIATEFGTIIAELYPEKAPVTVKNFLKYIDHEHYTGGSFFRTVRSDNQTDSPIKIDVIQAGPHPWFQFFEFEPIVLERTNVTGLKHLAGTLSMARDTPDTATSSFFICVEDEPELDFRGKRNPDGQGFAAFGRVVDGMNVVRKIHMREANGQAIIMPVRILEISY